MSAVPDLSKLSPERRRLIELLLNERGLAASGSSIPRRRDAPKAVTSFAQQRLWFIDRLEPGSPQYNIPTLLRLTGQLDIAAMENALNHLIERHEVLRTTFHADGSEPFQRIAPSLHIPLECHDLTDLPAAGREQVALEAARELARAAFDLSRAPLLRAHVWRTGEREHIALLTMHHIVSDGWSAGILTRELGALYSAIAAGARRPLPDLPLQYADYAEWQRGRLQGAEREAQLAWWKNKLAGVPALNLPADRTRPATQSYRGAAQRLHVPSETTALLREVAQAENASLFMLLLAAFEALLFRYTGQTDFCVGTPVSGRNRAELEGLIGFFVNMLPLRASVSGEHSFLEVLRRTREAVLEALTHQDMPFDMLVSEMHPDRTLGRTPFFQTMFVFENNPVQPVGLAGLTLTPLAVETETAIFDLSLTMAESNDGMDGWIEYSTDLFDADTIERLANHLLTLLAAVGAEPDRLIADLEMLTPTERRCILSTWNDTAAEYSRESTFHELFQRQVQRTPDAVAVWCENNSCTYRDLNRRANRLAHYLRAQGIGPEARVGLAMHRSTGLLAALLGILKAGGAYVPLDPAYPSERLQHILEDSGASLVLSHRRLSGRLGTTQARLLDLDELAPTLEGEPEENPAPAGGPSNLAYVIYTSGSTGTPKGVLIEHHSVANLACVLEREIYARLGSLPRKVALNASLCFDASVEELCALLFGHTLYVIPDEIRLDATDLLAYLRRHQVDVFECVPAQLKALLSVGLLDAPGPRLPVLNLGGEALDEKAWAALASTDGTDSYNSYGPTECTVDSTFCRIRGGPSRPSIGKPVANSHIYILDARMQPVPAGVPGELYIGGVGVARGYQNRPDITAERFVPDPFNSRGGARLYRTGDMARWMRDGNIDFLGRTDRQVKVRGFRIEPGEIEAALRTHPDVKQALVTAGSDTCGGNRLVAYIVPSTAAPEAEIAATLRDALGKCLPAYMIPSAFLLLDSYPLMPNGKVDLSALPAPHDAGTQASGEFVSPRDDLERRLTSLCGELLGISRVGLNENFFELGGDSIKAAMLANRLQKALGIDVRVRWVFDAPTLGALADRLRGEGVAGPTGLPAIEPVPRDGHMPLSFAQQRLWFLEQLEPGTPAYNVPECVRLSGPLQAGILERTLNEVVRRHEILRTGFITMDGRPLAVVTKSLQIALEVADYTHIPAGERERAVLEAAARDTALPFDLSCAPLFRVRLLRLSEFEHVFLLVMHHLVCDAWSSEILVREMAETYAAFAAGRTPDLPDLPVQYADFAAWQRACLQGELLEQQLAYWKKELADAPPTLDLPLYHARPAIRTYPGAYETFSLSPELSEKVRALSRQEGATLFMTLLAAFQALLHRYTGQRDICTGTPVANRGRAELEGLIGLFLNTLVIRTRFTDGPSFRDLLRTTRQTALAAYAHQDVPFDTVLESIAPERNLSASPLFQVMFVLQQARFAEALPAAGITFSPIQSYSGRAKFDLTLFMREEGETLSGALEYDAELFDRETIVRMAGHFETLLEALIASPDEPVSMAPLLSNEERRRMLVEWNNTAAELRTDRCFHHAFEEQVRRTPDAAAVRHESDSCTYADLNRRANRLAHYLRKLGVGPDVCVGLSAERSVSLIVGLLGIMKAGGAYLPLDPSYPRDRLEYMLEHSGASVLITTSRGFHPSQVKVHCVEIDAIRDALARGQARNPQARAGAQNLAYVIYTSGSTGTPKGVMVTHRGLVNYVTWCLQAYPLGAGMEVPLYSSVAFDLTITALLAPLAAGGTVHILPEELGIEALAAALSERGGYGVVKITPAHLQVLGRQVTGEQARRSTAAFIIGGENLRAEHIDFWQRHAPHIILINEYGPTETVVGCSIYRAERDEVCEHAVPIGKPILNTQLYVLDGNLEPVPHGVVGELYIGGAGVARGYVNRPDLTAARFVPDPFGKSTGARLYRSGDLARRRADGNLECLGRIDDQVKIRGFRVELGEIEAVLGRCPTVREAAVIAREDRGERQLVAYCVPAGGTLKMADVRHYLKQRLPDYMVPAIFVEMPALPLTSHGKVNRKTLPAPGSARPEFEAAFVAPVTPEQRTLAKIWVQALGLERVGIHDDFFELGGDSILSIQVIARANQAGLRLTPRQLFENPTIERLAAVAGNAPVQAAEQSALEGEVPLTPIQRWFFARDLEHPHHYNQSVIVAVRDTLDRGLLELALRHLVNHHDALRLRFIRRNGAWEQRYASPVDTVAVAWHDLGGLPADGRTAVMAERCAALQSSFDLSAGPLLRAAYFDFGAGQGGRLLLFIHHLAVDAVSWRILFEDFPRVYSALERGEAARLPAKTASYRQWAEAVEQHARSEGLRSELKYWQEVWNGAASALPAEGDGPNTEASAAEVVVSLGRGETAALVQEVPPVYRTEINDVLLTALWRALSIFTGSDSVVVDVEGHGREPGEGALDLSRTVGWFTAIYPVRLHAGRADWPGGALKKIKEQLRAVPNHGVGYGALKYMAGFGELPASSLCFNYLGQFETPSEGEGRFGQAPESPSSERSPRNRRSHIIEVNGAIAGGALELRWGYSTALHRRETIERLARSFMTALEDLIRHCRNSGLAAATPSDFPLARLDQEKLDQLLARAGARRKGI